MLQTKEKLLAFTISIVLVFFFIYGTNIFYSSPKRTTFCKESLYENIPVTKTSCEAIGGKWNVFGKEKAIIDINKTGWCNPTYTCDKKYTLARNKYFRTLFIIMITLGAISIIIGALMRTESVGAGFMGGGVLSISYGFIKYWGFLCDVVRFILLGIILVALIWIGYKKLNPRRRRHRIY